MLTGRHPRPDEINQLQGAAARFANHVDNWPDDIDAGSGLTKTEAGLIAVHIDYVVLLSGPSIPPIVPEPVDNGTLEIAFTHLSLFAREHEVGWIDPSTRLTRADLDLIVSFAGPPVG